MKFKNFRTGIFFIIVVILVLFYNGATQYNLTNNFDNLTMINSSQGSDNQTVSTFLPKLIWFEGNLQLEISSNQTGQIQCYLRESSGNSFTDLIRTINISNINQTQVFILKIFPYVATLPGVYTFRLNLTGLITYYEEFEIIFGLGFIPSLSVFGIGLVLIIYTLVKRTKKSEKKKSSDIVIDSGGSLIGKIRCPTCRKQIQEGLTFCPECGDRIPEFLRYNPVSGT